MATRWWPVACSSFIAECVLRSAPDFERCFLDLALADIRDASTVVSLPGASAIWSKRWISRGMMARPHTGPFVCSHFPITGFCPCVVMYPSRSLFLLTRKRPCAPY